MEILCKLAFPRTLLGFLALGLSCIAVTAKDELAGKLIYQKLCAKCHGDNGQGVKEEYKEPLIGDWSVEKLARYVVKNMPEEKPGLCVGEEANQVARYIHGSFYSVEAQTHVTLSRLTNRQYRESVSDLFQKA